MQRRAMQLWQTLRCWHASMVAITLVAYHCCSDALQLQKQQQQQYQQ